VDFNAIPQQSENRETKKETRATRHKFTAFTEQRQVVEVKSELRFGKKPE
jgi:hypothetical protein